MMPKQNPKKKNDGGAPANPSQPGTPQWIYDEIMRFIEPDLLSTEIPKHPEKYKSETYEEQVERMAAYDEAFMIFDKVAAEFEQEFLKQVKETAAKARKDAERKDDRKAREQLDTMEQEFHGGTDN